jgi:hypothetical protein
MARRETSRAEHAPVAGGSESDLRPGEKMLPAAQAGACQAHDASRDTGRSHRPLQGDGSFWTTQHSFHRAGESHCSSWSGSSGSPDLGHSSADPTPAGSSRVVANILSFCASQRIAASGAHTAPRAGWQTSSATLPAADASYGSGKDPPTVVNT